MAVRTYKLYGVAFAEGKSASLTVQFNGATVFTGEVATQNSASPKFLTDNSAESVIAEWTSTTDVTGTVPVAINGIALNEGNGLRPANITDGSILGDWFYKVPEGSVLTCNLYVDPDIIIVQ